MSDHRGIERFPTSAPWADVVGYSRAVRAGPLLFVSGTTSAGEDGSIGGGDSAYEQARLALAAIVTELGRAGASPAQVVQTRMYVTDIARWEEVGRAHGEVFGEVQPATAMVEVSALIDPAMLVEIEAVAWLGD